jgi:cytosine/adenosine deaminase-related metal-dependent hydrolase
VDLLIRGGTIVTCDGANAVVSGDLLVRGGRIAAVGKTAARAALTPARVLDARGCAVLPGLVQAHVHLCQVLFRGMADDLPLLEWLRRRIWPLEAAHDEKSARASAELGLLEAMRAGTTTLLDMGTVRAHDAIFDACLRSGARVFGGKTMMDVGDGVPRGLRESTRASLDESDRLRRDWDGRAGRIRYAYAPRFILSCSEELVRGAADRVAEYNCLFHSHAAEHPGERAAVREALGRDDIDVLRAWGAAGPRTILAHGVQLTDEEARAVAADGTRIVHCPSANLKLGSGVARVADLDGLGVQLALGCDGAPCNNNLDPWQELRHAALLAKMRTSPTALPAARALRLATIDGARALGVADEIGSLEVGKRADVIVVRIDREHEEPGGDVFSRLVYAAKSSDVEHVLVDGDLVVKNGEHTRFDAEAVRDAARREARRLVLRAGV